MQKLIVLLALLFFPALAYAQGFGSPNGVGFPSNGSGSGGSGTVTTFSATPSSVFDVANATTTPALSLDAQSGNKFLASPANGSSAAPTFRILDVADFPVLTTAQGGTGLSSWTGGDIPYYASGTALSKLAKGTALQYLRMNSGATAPEWATLSVLSNPMTTTGDIIQSSDNSGTPVRLARGTIGQRLEMGPSNLWVAGNQPAAAPTVRTPKLRKYGATFLNGATYKNYGWTGSGAASDDTDANGGRVKYITSSVANNAAYCSWSESYKPIQGFRIWFRTGMSGTTLADKSVYYGLTSNFGTLTATDSATGANYICVRRQGATDTNYQLAYCNSTTLTTVDTGISAALNDDHTWCLDITGTAYNVYCDGVLCATSGSNLPTSTTALFPIAGVATRVAAVANCNFWSAIYEGE